VNHPVELKWVIQLRTKKSKRGSVGEHPSKVRGKTRKKVHGGVVQESTKVRTKDQLNPQKGRLNVCTESMFNGKEEGRRKRSIKRRRGKEKRRGANARNPSKLKGQVSGKNTALKQAGKRNEKPDSRRPARRGGKKCRRSKTAVGKETLPPFVREKNAR